LSKASLLSFSIFFIIVEFNVISFVVKTQVQRLNNSFPSKLQTSLSGSTKFARVKNIKNDFSLFHHLLGIIAAIIFAHSGAFSQALVTL
jgi:hypothetical protein